MKILFAAGEATPFVKVGGLGDVAGALPKALVKAGDDVRVILPMYSVIGDLREKCRYITHIFIDNAWRKQYCGVFEYTQSNVTYYLIDNEFYFNRARVYGEYDDGERFAFFSRAVLEIMPVIDFIPDIIHCNDWHTALIPVLLDTQFRARPGYGMIKTVLTIHNIEFQGKFDPYILGDVFGLSEECKPYLYYDGCINLLKGGIECANRVTTVSPSYANEILDPYYAYGLEHILRARQYKVTGILNGIDVDVFNPETDKVIAKNYSVDTIDKKKENKFALQKELGLEETDEKPLIGMVTRLTHQKGLELVCRRLEWILGNDVQFVILGSGDEGYEHYISAMADGYQSKMRAVIGFDPVLAQKIYAGADFFLMPSEFEPCGLAQMIALRYGTLPIVRATGGLADTVVAFNPAEGTGNGINFHTNDENDMADAVWRAICLFNNPGEFLQAKRNAMSGDYSWKSSADKYRALYRAIQEDTF